jgi:hypothetical protein
MSFLLWFCLLALIVDGVLVAAVLILRLQAGTASITDLAPTLIVAGVLTALISFSANLRRARSDDLMKAATELLEKAFEELVPDSAKPNEPSNERLSWLSAARLISTAEKLSKRISEESHRLIYQEKREYWRTRLHLLIFPTTAGLPSSFYAEKPEHMIGYIGLVRPPLEEKSLAFLYRFIRWPDGLSDPIAAEPLFSDDAFASADFRTRSSFAFVPNNSSC